MPTWDGLEVSEKGSGPTVLYLHGYTMCARVWEPVWDALPGWRHIGLDLPWHGASRGLRDDEDLAGLADLIVSRAVAAGVRHVVALSFGTVLAWEMAVRHPSSFLSWTLSAPALAGMPHGHGVADRYVELARYYAEHGVDDGLTDLWMRCPPNIFAGVNRRPAVRARVRALIAEHRWSELAGDGMRRLTRLPQRAGDLADLPAPMLVLIGEDELIEHRACSRSIALAVPTASVQTIAGTGHLAPLEEPVRVAAFIDDHLQAAQGARQVNRSPIGPAG